MDGQAAKCKRLFSQKSFNREMGDPLFLDYKYKSRQCMACEIFQQGNGKRANKRRRDCEKSVDSVSLNLQVKFQASITLSNKGYPSILYTFFIKFFKFFKSLKIRDAEKLEARRFANFRQIWETGREENRWVEKWEAEAQANWLSASNWLPRSV